MSTKGSFSSMVGCPFYIADNPQGKSVTCEGFLPNNRVKVLFRNAKGLKMYIVGYCGDRYKDCPIYRMAMQKYEEER